MDNRNSSLKFNRSATGGVEYESDQLDRKLLKLISPQFDDLKNGLSNE